MAKINRRKGRARKGMRKGSGGAMADLGIRDRRSPPSGSVLHRIHVAQEAASLSIWPDSEEPADDLELIEDFAEVQAGIQETLRLCRERGELFIETGFAPNAYRLLDALSNLVGVMLSRNEYIAGRYYERLYREARDINACREPLHALADWYDARCERVLRLKHLQRLTDLCPNEIQALDWVCGEGMEPTSLEDAPLLVGLVDGLSRMDAFFIANNLWYYEPELCAA